MTLKNLVNTGHLKEHDATRPEIQALLEAARRNLADALVLEISLETRFDAAYKSVMQLAMVALMANGFRTGAGAGHHMIMIQSLPKAIGISPKRMVVLDALRRKRNVNDYMGGYVDQAATDACISEARQLREDLQAWRRERKGRMQN